MKVILVPIGGGDTDEVVLETAIAVARPLAAHLRFFHVRVAAGEAARHTPHADFARGSAVANLLAHLQENSRQRSVAAKHRVGEACARNGIGMTDQPQATDTVTASMHEADDHAMERLTLQARHSDLIVMARAKASDGLPSDRLERLLISSGRPLLVASQAMPRGMPGTVMVCWKETAEAARALAAAMPLVRRARRVVLVTVQEGSEDGAASLDDLVQQMRWHGVDGETRVLMPDGRSTSDLLAAAARNCEADLMVMGAYGRSRTRELLFGGCTRAVLDNADLPVVLAH